jgi:cytochrome b
MKSLIWGLPTRLFHWLLAIGFIAAYILGESEEARSLHFAFGALVGTLIFFRLIYGLFGPKYSHFRDFPIGIKNQKEFIKSFSDKTKTWAGHNPAASLIMLGIFLVGLACSLSGFLMYASENGLFSLGLDDDAFGEAHEVLANLFLFLVIIHLAGIFVDLVFHPRNGTLQSIFTGYKNVEGTNQQISGPHKIFSVIWFIVPFIFFYLAYGLQVKNENGKEEHNSDRTEQHESEEEDDD